MLPISVNDCVCDLPSKAVDLHLKKPLYAFRAGWAGQKKNGAFLCSHVASLPSSLVGDHGAAVTGWREGRMFSAAFCVGPSYLSALFSTGLSTFAVPRQILWKDSTNAPESISLSGQTGGTGTDSLDPSGGSFLC